MNILFRITEIDNWRVALEQTVATIDLELKKLSAAKEAVEQAVEAKVSLTSIQLSCHNETVLITSLFICIYL